MTAREPLVAPPGLENVAVAETQLSHVDGEAGYFVYRGHDPVELARDLPFEATWHLLLEGSLPDEAASRAYANEISRLGLLSDDELAAVRGAARGTPLAAIRSGLSALAAVRGLTPWLNRDLEEVRTEAMGIAAVLPTVVTLAWHAVRGSGDPALQEGDSYAARYLRALHGAEPDPARTRALDRYFTLTADHGMNASTFTARVVASTGADVGGCIVAALAALSGPLHGGAPTGVLAMLDEVGSADRAADWVRRELEEGRRLMGFGHRVYRTDDPRSLALKEAALEVGGPRVELAQAVEEEALAALEERRPGRALRTNVEFWAAMVFELCEIPPGLATATFACSRVVGWTAHVLEQAGANRIMRPTATYVGGTR